MLKVFLAEDEVIVREALRDSIPWEACGFTFAGEASDGETALEMVRQIRPDLILTDIKMPFMDGLTFSRIVSEELPATKIIIISGYDDFEYARQAVELHADQFLLKPVTKADMIAALEKARDRIMEEQERDAVFRKYRQETAEKKPADESRPRLSGGDVVEDALRYIDENYCSEDICLNTVAQATKVSANYLSTAFSQKVGCPFVEYLTEKRISRAKQLLKETGKRAGEIAFEVGYKDPRYFSSVFKRIQGCTPSEYRCGETDDEAVSER